MKKERIRGGEGYDVFQVTYVPSDPMAFFKIRSWISKKCSNEYALSTHTFRRWDNDRKMYLQLRYVALKDKDAMAFKMKFGSFQMLKAWDEDLAFTKYKPQ